MLHAQDEGTKLEVLKTWQPTVEACSSSPAETVSLDDLLQTPDVYQGKCVRTEGFFVAGALFIKERDIRREFPAQNEASADRRLGVYSGQEQSAKLRRASGKKVDVIGLVSHCASLRTEDTVMVMGYCHYTDGPVIGLALD